MKLLVVLLLIAAFNLNADVHSPYTSVEQFTRDGRDVKVTVLLGKPIKIFVSGKERLRVDASALKVEVRPALGNSWQELKMNEEGNYYSVDSATTENASKTLEVKTTLNNKKSEVFKFKTP